MTYANEDAINSSSNMDSELKTLCHQSQTNIGATATRAAEVEQCVYHWCTREARGTHSARALAAIYASLHLDGSRLLRFADLRALDDVRLEWALTLMRGYVEGSLTVPWARAVALVSLYELYPSDDD